MMFPLAHAWLIDRLIPSATNAHFLGCVWPDMLFESPLTHSESHNSGLRLVAARETLPTGPQRDEFRAFVAGVLSHGSNPHGFDWYSDEQYGDRPQAERGYAFQQGLAVADDAARACDVAPQQGWWKAHNLIEMAFEQPIYQAEPRLGDALATACADEPLCRRIANVLASIFGQSADMLATAMLRFPSVVTFAPATVQPQTETYALQTRLKHPGSAPDVAAIAGLIQRAQQIIAPTRDAFLQSCLIDVGQMNRALLPDDE